MSIFKKCKGSTPVFANLVRSLYGISLRIFPQILRFEYPNILRFTSHWFRDILNVILMFSLTEVITPTSSMLFPPIVTSFLPDGQSMLVQA